MYPYCLINHQDCPNRLECVRRKRKWKHIEEKEDFYDFWDLRDFIEEVLRKSELYSASEMASLGGFSSVIVLISFLSRP